MSRDAAKLHRLRKLERLREVAMRQAASEAAEAESALARLARLHERTGRLAAQYGLHRGPGDGAELRQRQAFLHQLAGLQTNAASDAARARELADARQSALAVAERRRSVVAEHVRRQQRALDKRQAARPQAARRAIGTDFE